MWCGYIYSLVTKLCSKNGESRAMWGRCGVDVGTMYGRCGIDVGSMWGRFAVDVGLMQGRQEVDVFVDGKVYRINEEVEVEEGNNKIVEEEANQD